MESKRIGTLTVRFYEEDRDLFNYFRRLEKYYRPARAKELLRLGIKLEKRLKEILMNEAATFMHEKGTPIITEVPKESEEVKQVIEEQAKEEFEIEMKEVSAEEKLEKLNKILDSSKF